MPSRLTRSAAPFIVLLVLAVSSPARALTLYVDSKGNDGFLGARPELGLRSADGPFATLERARAEIRKLKASGRLTEPVTVSVAGGVYALERPFALTAEDSGTEKAPITYRARGGEPVVLVGGREVAGFRKYRGKILQADVRALGLEKLKPVTTDRNTGDAPPFELFFNGARMDLARWPNHVANHPRDGEWAYTAGVPTPGSRTEFTYYGDRPKAWAHPEEAQVHLFPWWDWFDQSVGVKSVDAATRRITLDSPVGYDLQPGRRYFVRNVFEELDAPGEWYWDRRTETLYFYPPSPLARGKVFVSLLESVVTLRGVSDVTLRGFTIEGCRGTAVQVEGGARCRIAGCTIRNTGLAALSFAGGKNNGAVGNDISETGRGGISLSGGDRITLTPAGLYAENNHIHHFGRLLKCYEPGVSVSGVGNRVSHNLIHDAPHAGMLLSGNDHMVEFNELHHLCMEGSDNGAFYTGRDWTFRGNTLRYNKLHDIFGYGFDKIDPRKGVIQYRSPHGAQGIYLDDGVSSFHIYGNVLYRVGDMMVQLGGGRDNVIENNIFVDGMAVGVDARWSTYEWENYNMKSLAALPYRTPPWSNRYPELARPMRNYRWPEGNKLFRNIAATTSARENGYLAFSYTLPADQTEIRDNLVWNGGGPVRINANLLDQGAKGNHGAMPWAKWQETGLDKGSLLADPGFVDAAHDNYQLRDDSPAYKLGFKRIPMEQIGLYTDELRASPPPPADTRRGSLATVLEAYPIPGFTPKPEAAELVVSRASAPITIDGDVTAAEWGGADAKQAQRIEQSANGGVAGPPSDAWLRCDGKYLYIAFRNEVDARKPLRPGAAWGQDDAVEVALRNPGVKGAPIFVLRGYPNGHWDSSPEAGAPEAAARKLERESTFAAKVQDPAHWSAEWRIPLAALEARADGKTRLQLNLTVRKPANDLWLMWRGTGGFSWAVENAGVVRLAK